MEYPMVSSLSVPLDLNPISTPLSYIGRDNLLILPGNRHTFQDIDLCLHVAYRLTRWLPPQYHINCSSRIRAPRVPGGDSAHATGGLNMKTE